MFRTLLSIVALSAFAHRPALRGRCRASASASRQAAKAEPAAIVNLNTASVKDLETLPGIGAKTAERIIEYRQKNGPFKKIEELMNVQGIGEKSFLKLKPQLTVAPANASRFFELRPSQRKRRSGRQHGRTVTNHEAMSMRANSRHSRHATFHGLLTSGVVVRRLHHGNPGWRGCAAALHSARRVPGRRGRTIPLDTDSTNPHGSGEPVDECRDAIRRGRRRLLVRRLRRRKRRWGPDAGHHDGD